MEKTFILEVILLVHINSTSKVVRADLTKLQNEKPNDFNDLKNMGVARKVGSVLYPLSRTFQLSSPDDLISCLFDFCNSYNLKGCLSPLHDSDFLADGNREEPHFHFFTVSKAPQTAQLIGSLVYAINGFLPPIKKVENELGYFRYFTHQDDLNKALYSSDDIVCINGYTPPASGNGSTQTATEELLELADGFADLASLTAYVIKYRRDLANVLLRFKNILAIYYSDQTKD